MSSVWINHEFYCQRIFAIYPMFESALRNRIMNGLDEGDAIVHIYCHNALFSVTSEDINEYKTYE
jgi:hypothetical protein